jgi:hypothetical protein
MVRFALISLDLPAKTATWRSQSRKPGRDLPDQDGKGNGRGTATPDFRKGDGLVTGKNQGLAGFCAPVAQVIFPPKAQAGCGNIAARPVPRP